jgi:hypothetical protein
MVVGRGEWMSTDADVAEVLALLGGWRHLPAYRLESRADVFFALFMRQVVEQRVGMSLRRTMIPEFPLRRGTLWGEGTDGANASTKVDYALFSEDARSVFLVELKTDQASRRDEQDAYLEKSAGCGFRNLVDGILKIVLATESRYARKYLHLLRALEDLGFIKVPADAYDHAFPDIRVGLGAALRKIENLVDNAAVQVQVLYVQPIATSPNVIGFEEFALVAEARGGVGRLFATSLREWVRAAGDLDPRTAAQASF